MQERTRDRASALSELEYEALVDLCLGLTDKAMARGLINADVLRKEEEEMQR